MLTHFPALDITSMRREHWLVLVAIGANSISFASSNCCEVFWLAELEIQGFSFMHTVDAMLHSNSIVVANHDFSTLAVPSGRQKFLEDASRAACCLDQ